MGRLTGRTAIIAGGSKGIGYAISTTFAREGAEVAVVGSNAEAAEKTAQEIREASGKAIAVAADLTSEEGRAQVLTKTLAAFGKVDILINNAGWGCKSSFLETDMASFDRSINLNLKATYFMAQLAVKQMIDQGCGGRVINISSTAALQGERNSTIYSATKAGIISFTRALALEVGPYGITANCVEPERSYHERKDRLFGRWKDEAHGTHPSGPGARRHTGPGAQQQYLRLRRKELEGRQLCGRGCQQELPGP